MTFPCAAENTTVVNWFLRILLGEKKKKKVQGYCRSENSDFINHQNKQKQKKLSRLLCYHIFPVHSSHTIGSPAI